MLEFDTLVTFIYNLAESKTEFRDQVKLLNVYHLICGLLFIFNIKKLKATSLDPLPGVTAAQVYLNPSISSNERIAPIPIKNCPLSVFQSKEDLFQSEKELFSDKNLVQFQILGYGITPLPFIEIMHPSLAPPLHFPKVLTSRHERFLP